jgi:hypothetical protein
MAGGPGDPTSEDCAPPSTLSRAASAGTVTPAELPAG